MLYATCTEILGSCKGCHHILRPDPKIGVSYFCSQHPTCCFNTMDSSPQLSLEHLNYLLLKLPTYEDPMSPALQSLLACLDSQHRALSATPPATNPVSAPSRSSRGDKRLS